MHRARLFTVEGLRFGFGGFRFGVWGLGSGVWGLGLEFEVGVWSLRLGESNKEEVCIRRGKTLSRNALLMPEASVSFFNPSFLRIARRVRTGSRTGPPQGKELQG